MRSINIANKVTLGRLALTIVLLTVLSLVHTGVWPLGASGAPAWIALGLFVFAGASDWLDGYLARSLDIVTPFGRIADPFVDKMLVTGCLVLLTSMEPTSAILRPWMVVVIVSREFLVNGIRGWMESEGVNFQAAKPGKYKFVLQVASISGLLTMLALSEPPAWLGTLNLGLVWAMLALTLYSGAFYVRKAANSAADTSL